MANHRKDGQPSKKSPGRAVGAATRITRMRANEIAASGESPLDVMYENMLFWHHASQSIAEQIAKLGSSLKNEDQKSSFLKLLEQFLQARENSQRCAVDAAPYIHPKLASIAFKGELNHKMQKITSDMPASEAAALWAASIKGDE